MNALEILDLLSTFASKSVTDGAGDTTIVRAISDADFATLTDYIKTNGEGEPDGDYELDGLSLIDGAPEAGIQRLTVGLTELIVRDRDFDSID